MILIEVHPDSPIHTIQTKRGAMRKQEAYAHTLNREGKPNKYPTRIEFVLDDDAQPVPAGQYTLAPQSIYVDRFGGLSLSPKLVSAKR